MKNIFFGVIIFFGTMVLLPYEDVQAESLVGSGGNSSFNGESIHPEEGFNELELNNGSKWIMDDHTRAAFFKMYESFLGTKEAYIEGEGLKKAASSLQKDIDDLIKGCTMTGGAHDQLHTYLVEYIPAVEKLSKSGLIEDASKVRYYLENYGKYFK